MYNKRNQLSDVDIYPCHFYFFNFLFHTDVEEDEWGRGARGEYSGGIRGAGKGRVPGRWGLSKGENGKKLDKIRQHRFNNN